MNDDVCFRRTLLGDRGHFDAAAELTPALLVLNKLVLASEESRIAVKTAIFPPEADRVRTLVDGVRISVGVEVSVVL